MVKNRGEMSISLTPVHRTDPESIIHYLHPKLDFLRPRTQVQKFMMYIRLLSSELSEVSSHLSN